VAIHLWMLLRSPTPNTSRCSGWRIAGR